MRYAAGWTIGFHERNDHVRKMHAVPEERIKSNLFRGKGLMRPALCGKRVQLVKRGGSGSWLIEFKRDDPNVCTVCVKFIDKGWGRSFC